MFVEAPFNNLAGHILKKMKIGLDIQRDMGYNHLCV